MTATTLTWRVSWPLQLSAVQRGEEGVPFGGGDGEVVEFAVAGVAELAMPSTVRHSTQLGLVPVL